MYKYLLFLFSFQHAQIPTFIVKFITISSLATSISLNIDNCSSKSPTFDWKALVVTQYKNYISQLLQTWLNYGNCSHIPKLNNTQCYCQTWFWSNDSINEGLTYNNGKFGVKIHFANKQTAGPSYRLISYTQLLLKHF